MDRPALDHPARGRPGSGRPWGFVGMVVLVAAIEANLERGGADRANPTEAGFEWALGSATTDPGVADVVVLGDSVLKFGFSPPAFGRGTGRRADNWATVGTPPAVALSLLRAHLRAGGRPRAIVVDFKPLLLDNDGLPDSDAWARVATLADGLELARVARDASFAARFALAQALPSIRDRRSLRSSIASRLAGLPGPDRAEADARERTWRLNRGGHPLAPIPPAATPAEFPNEAPNLRLGWACGPTNAAIIARFFDLAARREIPVYWVLTPIHPRLQARRDALGIDAGFARFVLEQADRAPGRVTVVDARRLGLGPDHFVDATHLDRRGAFAFTAALASWFADLPPDRPGPRLARLEPLPPAALAAWGAGPDPDLSRRDHPTLR